MVLMFQKTGILRSHSKIYNVIERRDVFYVRKSNHQCVQGIRNLQ